MGRCGIGLPFDGPTATLENQRSSLSTPSLLQVGHGGRAGLAEVMTRHRSAGLNLKDVGLLLALSSRGPRTSILKVWELRASSNPSPASHSWVLCRLGGYSQGKPCAGCVGNAHLHLTRTNYNLLQLPASDSCCDRLPACQHYRDPHRWSNGLQLVRLDCPSVHLTWL